MTYENSNLETNPLQSLFADVKKILDFTEFKNLEKANAAETEESRALAEVWLNAKLERDQYTTYKNWWTFEMFLEIRNNITRDEFDKYVASPYSVPVLYQDAVLEKGRQAFFNKFEEKNSYYRMLQGLPNIDDHDELYMSEELEERFQTGHVPIHQLSTYVQSSFMSTDEYKELVEKYPDKTYLKYLGRYKIDLYTARKAKDYDIIRYPSGRSDINPNLLPVFAQLYADYREYVMAVLYNKQLENVYTGYRDFMGLLILFFTLLQVGNKAVEAVNSRKYLDDVLLHTTLSLYGIPDNLLMTKDVRRNLAIHLLKLVREKGTSDVYYDLIDILGYQDVVISKLMLMKGQQFTDIKHFDPEAIIGVEMVDENLYVFYNDNYGDADLEIRSTGDLYLNQKEEEPNQVEAQFASLHFEQKEPDLYVSSDAVDVELFTNPDAYVTPDPRPVPGYMEALDSFEPYFLQLDLKDKNPYKTIVEGRAPIYDYHSIIDGDPLWWDLPDVRKILQESHYTMSESKYIVIEAVIHQMEYLFESIFFTRMVIDNKATTDGFMIEIPEIFGTDVVSIYDLMLYLLCATCMSNHLAGHIVTHTDELQATAGFNFDLDTSVLQEFMDNSKYVEKERIAKLTSNLAVSSMDDIPRLLEDVMTPLREWLENKIASSTIREEFLEYEAIYKAIFTYDVTRNRFMDDFELPMETLQKKYNLTDDDLLALKYFYPHYDDGNTVTVDHYNQYTNDTKYLYPFLSNDNEITWYLYINNETTRGTDDRGVLYLYDVLNCEDVRELTNPDGSRIFMDYNSDDGWEINVQAVEQALYLIDQIPDDELAKAYFPRYTPVKDANRKAFEEDEKLPTLLRTGGVVKSILKEKITMDVAGLAKQPTTYFEALYRKNQKLYNLLFDGDRFNLDRNAWLNDVQVVVLAVESALSIHMKYFEQSVLGEDLFFQPLITLIKHFKSVLVDIAKTGLKYVFDDKVDAGGNSSMLKLFDELDMTNHHSYFGDGWNDSPFGIYDTEHELHYHITLNDRSQMIKWIVGEGFAAEERTAEMGSMRLSDEAKFYINGTELDPSGQSSYWQSGEPGIGRWTDDADFLMRARRDIQHVKTQKMDLDAWQDFVESYNPEA